MKFVLVISFLVTFVAGHSTNESSPIDTGTPTIEGVPVGPGGLIDLNEIVFREFLIAPEVWNLGQSTAHANHDKTFLLLDRRVARVFDLFWKEMSTSDGAKISQELWRRCMDHRWSTMDELLDHLDAQQTSATKHRDNNADGDLLLAAEECQRESSYPFNQELLSRLPAWEREHHQLFSEYGRLVVRLGANQ